MTDLPRDSVATSARGFQLGLFGALAVASAIAGFAAWLLFLPPREPNQLTRPEPRPALLDRPHRHRAASESSAASVAH